MKRYFDDFHVGDRFQSPPCTINESQIIAFAREFDPQPFHLEPEEAKQTLFGGLVASGWHTAAITMRLIVESDLNIAGGIVGLGVDELRFPKPVRPGDTLRTASEILELRLTRSRPDRGLIVVSSVTTNQDGIAVLTMKSTLLVNRRA